MKILVTKSFSLNKFVYAFILCLGLFSGYFGGAEVGFVWTSTLWNVGIMLMFIAIIHHYFSSRTIDLPTLKIVLIGIVICIVIVFVNIVLGINHGYAIKNLLNIFKVVMVNICLFLFARNPRSHLFEMLKSSFLLLNIFGVLNMIVLTIQINIKGFMIPDLWQSMNSYYPDLCAGLFGYNGTHRLGLFMSFLFIYNLYISDYVIKKNKKKSLYIYNLLLLIWHLVLSTQNDNMAIYVLTVIFLFSYIFFKIYWKNRSLLKIAIIWIKLLAPITIISIIVLILTPIGSYIFDDVMERIIRLFTVTSSTGSGSTERVSILLYSFERDFGLALGRGIGFFPFGGDEEFNDSTGFKHFGISSMTSFIYLMGIWFYACILIWFSKMYQSITVGNCGLLLVFVLMIIFFFTFYTTNLTSATISVLLFLVFSVFSMLRESIIRAEKRSYS